MTAKINDHYLSLQQMKSIINTTLMEGVFTKYKQNKLIQYLKQHQLPRGVNYAHSMIKKLVQSQLISPSIKTKQIEEQCPDVSVDEVKAKMTKMKQQRNSSINFRNYQVDSIQRSYRFKDTLLGDQFDDSGIHKKGLRWTTNRSSYFSETPLKQQKKKIYRHEKTLTQISPNHKKIIFQSRNLMSLAQYQMGVKHENPDQTTVKLNRQVDRQIQSLRNRKIKLQDAFSSFNQNKMKTFFGEQPYEKLEQYRQKESKNDFGLKNKKQKDSEPEFKCIITDYDGEIIAPLVTQKLKKVNAKNKQNNVANSFMPIVRVKTEIDTKYLQIQENKKSFKPSRKFIKHKDTICKPFSTAKQSKNSEKVDDQNVKKVRISLYNTQDDWTKLNTSLLKKKPQQQKMTCVKKIFDVDELSKSRRMIQKLNKSQNKLI